MSDQHAGDKILHQDEVEEVVRAVLEESGASGAGTVTLKKFEFAFDTPDLDAGVPVYVPAIGDVLLEAWFEVATGFDPAPASADISQFTGADAPYGMWGDRGGAVVISTDGDGPDDLNEGGGPLMSNGGGRPQLTRSNLGAGTPTVAALNSQLRYRSFGRFTSVDPLLLVVTEDGSKDGTPISCTVGAATLFFVVALAPA